MEKKPLMSDGVYNALKWIVAILLPAAATFYFTIASIWGLPAAEQVVGTIAALTTLGGVLLGVSTKQYNALSEDEKHPFDGTLEVNDEDPLKDVYSLRIDVPLEDLRDKTSLRLKVDPHGGA